jgi:HD-GYP domain-containing protein (c-di-GMP phosphodiesterase class II)
MLGGQQASTSTYRVKRKDGKYIWFQTRSHVLHDEVTGVPVEVHSTSHDVTRRQRAERLLNALNLADVAMGKALTPDTIFSAVAAELAKVDFYCMLFTCDESQSNLSATYLSHPRAALAAIEKFVGMSHERFYLPISSLGDYAKVVQERKTVLIDNIAELLYKAVPQLLSGLVAYVGGLLHQPRLIAAPLLMDDVVFAVLSIQSDELTEDDLPTVTAFANQMTSAWRKAKLLQDLRISLNESQKAHHDLQESLTKLRSTIDGAIETLGMTVEIRDPYTAGHQRRVADLASLIAQEMRLSEDQVTGIRIAAIVHDLGKLGVPVEILNKPGKLTDLEFTMIKTHPQMAFDLLKSIDFPWPIAQISLQHQERLDGSGYPQGLKGDAILLEARIIAVADVVEAMSSHRPYRPSLGMERTIEEITKYRGIRYDAEVVDACLRVLQSTSFFPA